MFKDEKAWLKECAFNFGYRPKVLRRCLDQEKKDEEFVEKERFAKAMFQERVLSIQTSTT